MSQLTLDPSTTNSASSSHVRSPFTPDPSCQVSNNRIAGTNEEDTLFFDDGLRRIDFVLVYTDDDEKDRSSEKRIWRRNFQDYLQMKGLHIETFDANEKVHYVKVHTPLKVLEKLAEIANLNMPYMENDITIKSIKSKIPSKFIHRQSNLPLITKYFTAPFIKTRGHDFIREDGDSFFTPAHRSLLTYQILRKAIFDPVKNKFGIDRIISLEGYDAAFPLHAGSFKEINGVVLGGDENLRYILYKTWASKSEWYKTQPLDHIRKYFGEMIALYFAWLGCYTMWLIPFSVVGFIVFIFSFEGFKNVSGIERCDDAGTGNVIMCPLCDRYCMYWRLSDTCHDSKLSFLSHQVSFALFMCIWAVVFKEMWGYRQKEHAYDWGIQNFQEEESLRPEYIADANKTWLNPITQVEEPHHDPMIKCINVTKSIVVVIFMVCVVIACFWGIIVYEAIVVTIFHSSPSEEIKHNARQLTSLTSACISLVTIVVLDFFYGKLAKFLTDGEFPRTQTEWENNFTFKMFIFHFVNNYFHFFYIALVKSNVMGRPGNYERSVFGKRLRECISGDCMIDLFIQLSVVMVGKQILNNVSELIIPFLTKLFYKSTYKQEGDLKTWEIDYLLCPVPELGVIPEYFEMVIQYGFITMFATAFPLAPLCALINNIIEIRLDAYKYTTQFRRPLARRAQDIGVWRFIINGVTHIAILTNALIIGFTSDYIPKLVYKFHYSKDSSLIGYTLFSLSVFNISDFEIESVPKGDPSAFGFGAITECRYRGHRHPPNATEPYNYTSTHWRILAARLAFVLCFIMLVLFFGWVISYHLPDIPENVKMQKLREKQLAYEAALDKTEKITRRESPLMEIDCLIPQASNIWSSPQSSLSSSSTSLLSSPPPSLCASLSRMTSNEIQASALSHSLDDQGQ